MTLRDIEIEQRTGRGVTQETEQKTGRGVTQETGQGATYGAGRMKSLSSEG